MIGEEFIVACLILFSGVIFDSIETVTAIFIAYILHLILHIREAFIFPGWAPGSRTAVFTMPLNAITLYAIFATQHIDYLKLVILTVVLSTLGFLLTYRCFTDYREGLKRSFRRLRNTRVPGFL